MLSEVQQWPEIPVVLGSMFHCALLDDLEQVLPMLEHQPISVELDNLEGGLCINSYLVVWTDYGKKDLYYKMK